MAVSRKGLKHLNIDILRNARRRALYARQPASLPRDFPSNIKAGGSRAQITTPHWTFRCYESPFSPQSRLFKLASGGSDDINDDSEVWSGAHRRSDLASQLPFIYTCPQSKDFLRACISFKNTKACTHLMHQEPVCQNDDGRSHLTRPRMALRHP